MIRISVIGSSEWLQFGMESIYKDLSMEGEAGEREREEEQDVGEK